MSLKLLVLFFIVNKSCRENTGADQLHSRLGSVIKALSVCLFSFSLSVCVCVCVFCYRVNAGKYGRFLHIGFSPTPVLFIPASYNQIPVFILEYCHLEPLAVE